MFANRFSLLLLLCLSSLLCTAQAPGDASPRNTALSQDNVQLVQIGIRSYPDGSRVPIWAVMMGDTAQAERIARGYRNFGPYGLNATLWTRTEGMPQWARTTYRRPRNAEETVDWYRNREPFTAREQGDSSLLPAPFGMVAAELIEKVDFIVQYDDGSAKVYLYAGTSTEDAQKIVSAVTATSRTANGSEAMAAGI